MSTVPEHEPSEATVQVIDRLLASQPTVAPREVARVAGVTRQAAHRHLAALVASGELVREGAGRSTRYRRRALLAHTYDLDGLREDEVWADDRRGLDELDPDILAGGTVRQVLGFALTEMVNNAIDHSRGSRVSVRWFLDDATVAFEVEDDGVGAFATVREEFGLDDDYQAIGELSKGRQTTQARRHSGLGILLTSRLVDEFTLAAGHYVWRVVRARGDSSIGWLDPARLGTLVRVVVDRATTATLPTVMDELSGPSSRGLDRTSIRVSLFSSGDFVSRSEAKLVGSRLEAFGVVELDFTGVNAIGQAFADELFRVWPEQHPDADLVAVHTNPAIDAMIAAARRASRP
jgi:anti-sigma regulatory factor (Ser/Thr protein kinase)